MGSVQQAIENSHQQGREEGVQQGIQQGIQQGEDKKAVEVAKMALNEGIQIGMVSKISGLSEETIRKLLMHQPPRSPLAAIKTPHQGPA